MAFASSAADRAEVFSFLSLRHSTVSDASAGHLRTLTSPDANGHRAQMRKRALLTVNTGASTNKTDAFQIGGWCASMDLRLIDERASADHQ
jgi:hypothetical protein